MEVVIAIFSTALVFSGFVIYQKRSFSLKFEDYNNLKATLSGLESNIEEAQNKLNGITKKLNQSMLEKTLLDEETQRLTLNNERLAKEIETQEVKKKCFETDIKAISENYTEVDEKYTQTRAALSRETAIFNSIAGALEQARKELYKVDEKTKSLQSLDGKVHILEDKEKQLYESIGQLEIKLSTAKSDLELDISKLELEKNAKNTDLLKILSRIDLYSRVDEFTKVGHFEEPNYLYETSLRYSNEIKEVRESQRGLIKQKKAVTYPDDLILCSDKNLNKKILEGQANPVS
ncbi:MAG: hypothetical protein ABL858_07380, partial [Candidatus Nitrotoga sp.]